MQDESDCPLELLADRLGGTPDLLGDLGPVHPLPPPEEDDPLRVGEPTLELAQQLVVGDDPARGRIRGRQLDGRVQSTDAAAVIPTPGAPVPHLSVILFRTISFSSPTSCSGPSNSNWPAQSPTKNWVMIDWQMSVSSSTRFNLLSISAKWTWRRIADS